MTGTLSRYFPTPTWLSRFGSLPGISRFRDEAVGNADEFPLCDGIVRRGCIIGALIQTCVEAFDWLVRIEGFLELPIVLCQVRRQYPCVVRVEVDEKGQCGGSGVSGERILEGGEVCVLKFREELITEGSVNVTTFIVFSKLFSVLAEERLLVEGGSPLRDYGCATGFGQENEWLSGDEDVVISRKDNPEVAVLAPAAGTLD